MMMDEASSQPQSSSSSDKNNVPPPEPDPPPNENNPGSRNLVRMSSPSPSQISQPQTIRSRAHSSGTSEDNQSSPNSTSTPPWLKWSRGLNSLLDDQQGRDLFEKYLDQEGCSMQLQFLWACEGLKCVASEDPPKIPQLVRSIYRNFIQNNALLGITDKTRSELAQAIKIEKFNEVTIYDKAEEDVQTHMQDNLYPNFLRSEIYLHAVNGEDENSSHLQEQLGPAHPDVGSGSSGRKSSSGDASSGGDNGGGEQKACISAGLTIDVDVKSGSEGQSPKIPSPPLSTVPAPSVLLPNQLQTVHEDKELSVNAQAGAGHQDSSKLKLTKAALHLTQLSRATVPVAPVGSTSKIRTREVFTGSHFHPKPAPPSTTTPLHPYHASYSSYNPVSRVDSEIQSMSSDAMTDDGAHSGHGHSGGRKHPHHHHRSKSHQQLASSHLHLHQPQHSSCVDARRQIAHSGVHLDNRDNLPKYIAGNMRGTTRPPNRDAEQDPKAFAEVLIKKLEDVKRAREAEEKMNQRMPELSHHAGACGGDEHGGGVLAAAINKLQVQDDDQPGDILDKHVSRVFSDITPNPHSPNLRSPTSGRRRGGPNVPDVRPRRERDVISTFSGDSGNVHDFPCDTLPSSMTKSRSIPSEMKIQDHGDFGSVGLIGASQRGRLSRGGVVGHGGSRNVPLALMTKKTSSEFLDSGISVFSGQTPTVISSTAQPPPPLPCERTDLRVMNWMKQCGDDRRPRSTTSPPLQRRSKKQVPMAHSSAPMPPTPTLEEVRRRLTKKPPPLPSALAASQSMQVPIGPLSSFSSSGNPLRHQSPPSSDESSSATSKEHFISSFVFYDDIDVPYSVKIPCKLPSKPIGSSSPNCGITLAVFKEHLPKRGNYRYFFKRDCAEVCTKVVQEEITDDLQELPLYDGRIIAHLQAAVGTSSMSASTSVSDKL